MALGISLNGIVENITHSLDKENNPKFQSAEGLGMGIQAIADSKGFALTSLRYGIPFSPVSVRGTDICISLEDRHSNFTIQTPRTTRLSDGLNRVEKHPDHTVIHVQAGSLVNIETSEDNPILINIIT